MTMLTVVYLQSTGNVLATLTRAAPPGPGEPVTALVGTSLPVRAVGSTSTQMTIPASALAAVTVNDTQPDAVLDPQGFQVVDDPQDKTVHLVTPIPQPTASPPPTITPALDVTGGAVINAAHVTTATLTVVAVLQKVTMPPQAATVIGPVTLVISSGKASFTAAPGTELASATWDFAAFTAGMLPQATSASL